MYLHTRTNTLSVACIVLCICIRRRMLKERERGIYIYIRDDTVNSDTSHGLVRIGTLSPMHRLSLQ